MLCVLGGFNGAFLYFKNTGTATAPVFTESKLGEIIRLTVWLLGLALPSFSRISTGTWTTSDACVTGMDTTGTTTSTKYYYKNTGTQATPTFTLQSGGDNIFDVTTVDPHLLRW
jgi:hypothetical protein